MTVDQIKDLTIFMRDNKVAEFKYIEQGESFTVTFNKPPMAPQPSRPKSPEEIKREQEERMYLSS